MKKLIVITFAMVVASSLLAMQQQHEQEQKQQTKKTTKNRNKSDQHSKPEMVNDDVELEDLKMDMAAIVQAMESNQVSVTNATKPVEKKHERICPTCGRPAEFCPVDRDRIAHGEILTCGCRECGGARNLLWLSQFAEVGIEYFAHGAIVAIDYASQKINDFTNGGS